MCVCVHVCGITSRCTSLNNDFSEGFDTANPDCIAACNPSTAQSSITLFDTYTYDTTWGGGAATTTLAPTAWPLCSNDLTAAVCVYSEPNNYHSVVHLRHGGRGAVRGQQVDARRPAAVWF